MSSLHLSKENDERYSLLLLNFRFISLFIILTDDLSSSNQARDKVKMVSYIFHFN